jgi:hypothetical protein
MGLDELAEGWEVWSEQERKVVLAYRPDVFDTQSFPAACLPTLYITHGQQNRRPGREQPTPETPWYVTLYLEPEVNRSADRYESRNEAIEGARVLARAFADGEIDYRGLYQIPRAEYFEHLDELTGWDDR